MPNFSWEEIKAFTEEHFGRDATRAADDAGMELGEMAAFIATLANMEDEDAEILNRLREPNGLLKHLFAGFMYHVSNVPTLYELIRHTDLTISGTEEAGIISGSMFDWHKAITKLCIFGKPYGVRLFLNLCLLHFEKGGMRQFFENYARDGLPDGTFELRLK